MIRWFRAVLAAFMIAAGIMHFLATDSFAMIVPDYLPWPRLLVQLSGAAEIALGLGLLVQADRHLAGAGLILLYLSVGAWLGGIAIESLGDYTLMWYVDAALAGLAALVNLPIREARIAPALKTV